MAKESVAIIKDKLSVKHIIEVLNKALAEEWLAFYQYWIGATVMKGAMPNFWSTASFNSTAPLCSIHNNGLSTPSAVTLSPTTILKSQDYYCKT